MNNAGINKSRVALRFSQAGHSYARHAIVQKQIVHHVLHLMHACLPQAAFERVFEIGCGSGNLTRLIQHDFQISRLILNDLYDGVQQHFPADQQLQWWMGDIEQLTFPEQLNMIVSSSALQWMTRLEEIFRKSAAALTEGGYLCFSTFGPQNLREIKTLTGQGLDYDDIESIREQLIRQGFETLHLSEQIETLTFEHPQQILQHLKATGVTATAGGYRWTRQGLEQFYQAYAQFLQSDASAPHAHLRYPLSYHPIYCIARRKP
ncbi:malonyl-ACP O-methyltransferase BioC [Acinetobacter sp. WZC-1]|uniref:malonyl-ACP O-methyltransferase BioC n=1 Tax=Acinetobacter sp. WZC-1 TaxID=3459034 RepID=UPI00403D8B89